MRKYVSQGFRVRVETGAGRASSFDDEALVTRRMLEMFKKKEPKKAAAKEGA